MNASRRLLLSTVLSVGSATILAETPYELHHSAGAINTVGYEDSPFLSPDGQAVYFMYTPWTIWPTFFGDAPRLVGPARAGHRDNPDNNPWEDSDLYVSWRQPDGRWGVPENLGFNDQQADCCAMTWNHEEFFYQRTQFPNSALTDLYVVRRLPDGRWDRRSLGPLVNLAGSSEQNPHVTGDGEELYFTSNRLGGDGGTDLYLSRRQPDGSWGLASPLPATINTPMNEDQAWLTADGQTLYFNREPGPRIMVSRRVGDTWSTASPVGFGGHFPDAGEVSGTNDGQRLVFAVVRPELGDLVIVTAQRQPDGRWGEAVQIDAFRPPRAPSGLHVTP